MHAYQYLIAPALGWVVAQSIKFGLSLRKDGVRWGDVVQSGGMPSSHSAFMAALVTVIGLQDGVTNVAFAISASVTAIVLYDAMGVRRTTGQQTAAIKELAKYTKMRLKTEISPSKGHSPLEVVLGTVTGILVGYVVYAVL